MIILKQYFSRERTLAHFCMWERSDRAGYARHVGSAVPHILFLMSGPNQKVRVYHAEKAMTEISKRIEERFTRDSERWQALATHLETAWKNLSPYVHKTKTIEHADAFLEYFHHLTDYWTAMSIIFLIPDIETIDPIVREQALTYRIAGEKYSELTDILIENFWKMYVPESFRNLLPVVTPEELAAIVRGETSTLDTAKIRERLRGYGLLHETVYTLPELERALEEHDLRLEDETIKSSLTEIHGTTAQAGYASGPTRIVIKKSDITRVQPGDVIVADMTNPSFVPWMKTASAFVTDEGGLTCHAAIVAREFGKPCIIGTKIATKVFKDGDEVEVDATKGVVRRI